jgi:hypothetical protein
MAHFILPTLQAVAFGDVSRFDACYSISAHLASVKLTDGKTLPSECDIQACVKQMVNAVADGVLTTEQAASQLIELKERILRGEPLEC